MNNLNITLATKITIARMIVIPFVVISIIQQNWALAFWLTLFAGLSDILDGKIARRRNETSHLGSILDPLADKLLTLSCFFTLAIYGNSFFKVTYLFLFLIFFKELILILGAWFLLYKDSVKINPSIWGKAAMVGQTFLINFIFLFNYLKIYPINTYLILLCIVTILILLSLYQYAKIGIKQLILYFIAQK